MQKCVKSTFANSFQKKIFPGANDGEACQQRTDVTHLTLRGPQRGRSDLFSKYISPYSAESILSLVYSTYPAISTGIIR